MTAVSQPSFLIVDDEPLIGRTVARVLRPFGSVHTATSLRQARELLLASSNWLGFVIDLRLPDGSGLQLLSDLRPRFPHAPAILLSGAMNPEGINGAYGLSARCLCKPWPQFSFETFAREALTAQQEIPRRLSEAVSDLANRHALTRAQTEILSAAVRGVDRASIVAERHVSENTHKTQVRGILRKTRTLSLGELRDRVLRAVTRPDNSHEITPQG